jgi:post-segregation antitoxin (ccd killing protein)
MAKLLSENQLEERARKLGVDISGDSRTQSSTGQAPRATDFELQRRVIEAERATRESRLWIIAVIAAIASVVSAAGAWTAVMWK